MTFIKKTFLIAISAVTLTSSFAYATTDSKTESENIDVTPDNKGTSPEELAAIYVLSEICPSYGLKNDENYQTGYANLVKDYMPDESNPVNALNEKAQQKDFLKYIKEARKDAKKAGDTQNQDICKEITTIK